MSSEEDIDEHSDMDEWNLDEPLDEPLDGTQHFNEGRYVLLGYVMCINLKE